MEFAPVNTTGNFRSLKFVKYLRDFGIEPIVITFKEDEGAAYFNTAKDNALMDELPEDITIYRIHCDDGSGYYDNRFNSFLTIYFSVKDTLAKRWKPHLFRELEKIIKDHSPKLIFTSLPPFSSGMLAAEIATKYKLPLMVDMRDLFARWGNTPFGSVIHYWLTLAEERSFFKKSKAIVCVTPQLVQIFRESHPKIEPQKFHLLPNGFDSTEEIGERIYFSPNKEKIIIGYVGSFYYDPEAREGIFKPWWRKRGHKMLTYTPVKEDWLYRSPYFFFKTIARLFNDYPEFRTVISIEFIGNIPDWLPKMIEEFGLSEHVKMHGFIPHKDALSIQRNFDLLLATSEMVIGGEHYSLPSKIFDSIGLNKPILGFVTEGIQKEFIVRSGLGLICEPDNVDGSVSTLVQLLKSGKEFKIDKDYVESFRRRNITRKLADLIKLSVE